MKKGLVFTFGLVLLAISSMAQKRPDWIINRPSPTNNSYLYVVEYGTGQTEMHARNRAIAEVFLSTARRIGQPIDSEEINRALQRGEEYKLVSSQYNIPINKVCEYSEKDANGYRVYVLCQAAKAGNIRADFDEFKGCYEVKQFKNSTALIKSALIPGLGQIGKQRVGEGVCTLVGEVATIGGVISSYLMAQKQLDIMKNVNTSYTDFMTAREKYNTSKTVYYACLGTAAALYVFNLYRAYFSTPVYKDSLAFNSLLIPTDNSMALGLSLTYKF